MSQRKPPASQELHAPLASGACASFASQIPFTMRSTASAVIIRISYRSFTRAPQKYGCPIGAVGDCLFCSPAAYAHTVLREKTTAVSVSLS